MKWWHWLILELLIIFGVMAWIYFFPSEFEYDFAKGVLGFVLIYAIEECKNIDRRKRMDYKEGMTCGKCLKYAFCPVANHNVNHKACMKITTEEYHTIEQNVGENQIEGRRMKYYVLRTIDWTPDMFLEKSIVPFGWCESDRAVPCNEEIYCTCDKKENATTICHLLNAKITGR